MRVFKEMLYEQGTLGISEGAMRASWTPEGCAAFVALGCAEPGTGTVTCSAPAYPVLLRQYTR